MAREIKDPVKRAWYAMAHSHGSENESFHEIHYGSEQWKSWAGYFFLLGWQPWNLHQTSWTAPCEWPSDLPEFKAPPRGQAQAAARVSELARLPASERQSHVARLHAEGKLNFTSDHDVKLAQGSWWDRFTPAHAVSILAKHERESQQQQSLDSDLV